MTKTNFKTLIFIGKKSIFSLKSQLVLRNLESFNVKY